MEDYSVIGKRIPRVDGRVKVTGEAKYAADFEMPGMLWCKILRSPFPHAKILNIDTSRAEKLPGVKGVITGKDFDGWTAHPDRKFKQGEDEVKGDKNTYTPRRPSAVRQPEVGESEEALEVEGHWLRSYGTEGARVGCKVLGVN